MLLSMLKASADLSQRCRPGAVRRYCHRVSCAIVSGRVIRFDDAAAANAPAQEKPAKHLVTASECVGCSSDRREGGADKEQRGSDDWLRPGRYALEAAVAQHANQVGEPRHGENQQRESDWHAQQPGSKAVARGCGGRRRRGGRGGFR